MTVCFFPMLCLQVGSDNVASVRIRSTMSICLLHGLVLLPCWISGKMTIPSKSLLSLLANCSLFCYAYAVIPTTCLAMLPFCSTPLIALLVVGEDWRLFHVGTWIFLLGYHNISYLINASIYLVKGGRLGLYAWCFVPLLPP